MSAAPRLCTLESRRANEMATLITKFGGIPISAPSMKEVPLDENQPALETIKAVVEGRVDALVLLTGVGTEAMLQIAESVGLKNDLLEAMARIPLLLRGPKPAAVLKKLNLSWAVKARAPNTWQDLLTAIEDSKIRIAQQTIAVQEYGIPNPEFYAELKQRQAIVLPMPVYRWALPDDLSPLQSAVHSIIAKDLDAVLFTSAQQLRHLLTVAEHMQLRQQLVAVLPEILISSIGPTCSEALREETLPVHFEASPPKMGPLVRGTMQALAKRS